MKKYTTENAYRHIKEAIEHFGCFPKVEMYKEWSRENDKIGYDTVLKLTGKKWREIEIELRGNRDKRAREDYIIQHLQNAARIYGDNVSKREYIEYSQEDKENRPSIIIVANVFSTFNKAKLAAGLNINEGFKTEETSKQKCIEALKKASEELGESFTEPQYIEWVRKEQQKGNHYPSSVTIRKRFGKFSSGLKEASLNSVYEITEQEIHAHVFEFLRDHITVKNYDEWAKENNKLLWENFSKRGFEFRETMMRMLKNYLQRR